MLSIRGTGCNPEPADPPNTPEPTRAWDRCGTIDEIAQRLNQAADQILEATEVADTGLRDRLHLMVNLTLLENPSGTVESAVVACYDADPEKVLSWIMS